MRGLNGLRFCQVNMAEQDKGVKLLCRRVIMIIGHRIVIVKLGLESDYKEKDWMDRLEL